MAPAKITFISPKGYGMAVTKDSRHVFVPSRIVQENGLRPEDEVEMETEPGEMRGGLRAISVKVPGGQ